MTHHDSPALLLADLISEVIGEARVANIRDALQESSYFFWLGLEALPKEEQFGHLVVSTYTHTYDTTYHPANGYHPSWGYDAMDLVIYGHGCRCNFDSYTYVSFWLGESAIETELRPDLTQ